MVSGKHSHYGWYHNRGRVRTVAEDLYMLRVKWSSTPIMLSCFAVCFTVGCVAPTASTNSASGAAIIVTDVPTSASYLYTPTTKPQSSFGPANSSRVATPCISIDTVPEYPTPPPSFGVDFKSLPDSKNMDVIYAGHIMLAFYQGAQTPSYLLTIVNTGSSDITITQSDFEFKDVPTGTASPTLIGFINKDTQERDKPVLVKPGTAGKIIMAIRNDRNLVVTYNIMGGLSAIMVPIYLSQPLLAAMPTLC